jgi:hypothetical protein
VSPLLPPAGASGEKVLVLALFGDSWVGLTGGLFRQSYQPSSRSYQPSSQSSQPAITKKVSGIVQNPFFPSSFLPFGPSSGSSWISPTSWSVSSGDVDGLPAVAGGLATAEGVDVGVEADGLPNGSPPRQSLDVSCHGGI